jgi:hypothetical protein
MLSLSKTRRRAPAQASRRKPVLLPTVRSRRLPTQSLLPSVEFVGLKHTPAPAEAAPATPAEPEMIEVWRPGRPQANVAPATPNGAVAAAVITSARQRRPKVNPRAKHRLLRRRPSRRRATPRRQPMASARNVTGRPRHRRRDRGPRKDADGKSVEGQAVEAKSAKASLTESKAGAEQRTDRPQSRDARAPSGAVATGRRAKIVAIAVRGASATVIAAAATTTGQARSWSSDQAVARQQRAAIRTRRSPSCWP